MAGLTCEISAIAFALLGSNQGSQADILRQAVFRLADARGVELLRTSSLYQTPPWGNTQQPAFLNAAVELRTSLAPADLMACFHAIEQALGRNRANEERWGPRTVDIDLALFDRQIVNTDTLTIPHPRLAERAFALIPLLEIQPDASDPRTGEPYRNALYRLGEKAVEACERMDDLLLDASMQGDSKKFRPGLYISRSSKDTQRLARAVANQMRGGEVLAMVGNLGAGKTCFASGFASGLGIKSPITSPSYVLVKSYEEGRLVFHHADFYRLAQTIHAEGGEAADLASLGLEDYLDDSKAVILVEWADRFPSWLEPPYWIIQISGSGCSPRFVLLRQVGAISTGNPANPVEMP